MKYASPGKVRIRAAPANGGGVDGRRDAGVGEPPWTIRVSDEGPGIPADHVDRIFRAFARGTMEGKTGVGLGLAIASRSAAMLGGTLGVESKLGEGSTFTLTLPTTATATATTASP